MFVVTFYSYKGGVGRTSALMNVAYRFAQQRKQVMVLDFDLEAPGIDSFHTSPYTTRPRPGIVEYIAHFMDNGEVAPLEHFIYDITPPHTDGKIMMMPAGKRDAEYQSSLSKLDWKVLYRQKSGFLFVENLKAAIKNKYAPDYVFVDSRTGLTDVSGICTMQLPDLVVLLFSLNNQNVGGTAQIYNSIRNNKLNRQITTLLVASPIPDVPESLEIRRERFENARKCIGASPDLILPFDPFMAFQETIAVSRQSQALINGYNELAARIIGANSSDILTLLREAQRLTAMGNPELAELKYREVVDNRPENYEAWVELGIFQKTRNELLQALESFRHALSLAPNSTRALAQVASTSLSLNRVDEAVEYAGRVVEHGNDADELSQLAQQFIRKNLPDITYRLFRKAGDLSPSPDNMFQLGEAAMALQRYEEAYSAYRIALNAEPTSLVNVFNAGYAAHKANHPDARDLFLKAIELWGHDDPSRRSETWNANAASAIAQAYLALGQVSKAVGELLKARKIASALPETDIFSVWSYTYISKQEFIKKIDDDIQSLQSEHSDVIQQNLIATTITISRQHGNFLVSIKSGDEAFRYSLHGLEAVRKVLFKAGLGAAAISRYVMMLTRQQAIQLSTVLDQATLQELRAG